jgi:hypothetical protein
VKNHPLNLYSTNNFQSQVKEKLGEWLHNFEWDIWCTFTFRFAVKNPFNAKKYFERFNKNLNRNISYFIGIENFKTSDNVHIHALLEGVKDITYVQLGQIWYKPYGYAYIRKYDPKLGASYYITKYVTKEFCDWDIHFRSNSQLGLNLVN